MVGSSVKVYFPEGAKDFVPIKGKFNVNVSNFNICMNENIYLYQVDACGAHTLLDIRACNSVSSTEYKFKAPRKELRRNQGFQIGARI